MLHQRILQGRLSCYKYTLGRGQTILQPIPALFKFKVLNEILTKAVFNFRYIGEHISDHEADRREDDSYLFDLDNKVITLLCIIFTRSACP